MKLVTFDLPDGRRHIGAMLPGEQGLADFTAAKADPNRTACLRLPDDWRYVAQLLGAASDVSIQRPTSTVEQRRWQGVIHRQRPISHPIWR